MSKTNLINIRKNSSDAVGTLAKQLLHGLNNNAATEAVFVPKADVWESETGFHVNIYLPGINPHCFDVALDNDFLIVTGIREMREDFSSQKIKLLESNYGSFQRRIKLNAKADTDIMQAKLEDGVLYILIPKKQAAFYMQTAKVA